jgi:flagellar motor component MotA
MYSTTITVLVSMIQEGSSNSIHGEAGSCLIVMKSFEFIFILYFMHKIMGTTNLFCRVLQQKSLNILNAMNLVTITKALLRTLRDVGFDLLPANMQSVCIKYEIDIPHMNASYKKTTGRSYQQ